MYKSIVEVNKRVIEHRLELQRLGHDYFFVALQGSWNYGLGYEGSDVDTKALILPSLRDVVRNKEPISTTHIMENNEHLDLKDARIMFKNFWKQNINFLEILFSEYVSINPVYLNEYFELTEMAEDIAHYDERKALNCMCGMAFEKLHALEHPYPTIIDKIEKYGYDGKQMHHIMRMENFMDAYTKGRTYSECLISFDVFSKEQLMKAKRNEYSLETARETSKMVCDRMEQRKEFYLNMNPVSINTSTKEAAEEILYSVFEQKFKYDIYG